MAVNVSESFPQYSVLYQQTECRLGDVREKEINDVQSTLLKLRLCRLKENLHQLNTGRYQNHLITNSPCKLQIHHQSYKPITIVRNGHKLTAC